MIKIVCASDKKGGKRMSTIRENIEHNDDLHRVFPHLHPRGVRTINKKMLYLERPNRSPEPSVEAIGITSSATGDRATGLIPDDAVDQRNSVMQPKMRETIRNAWGDWYSLLPPDGWLFWISNLWHRSDLTHELMANEAYAVAMYEVNPDNFGSVIRLPDGTVRRDDDTPLWPEMWGKKELAEQKRVHKAQGFARLFSLRPMTAIAQRVDKKWLIPWKTPPADDWLRILVLDLAESEEAEADFTGIIDVAISLKSPKIKVMDAYHFKLDFDGKIQLMKSEHRSHGFADIAVEKSAGAISLAQHVVAKHRLPIRLIPIGGKSKAMWLDEAIPYLKAGVVEWNPWLLEQTGQLGERGDPVAEITDYGSYPTDNILDAFTRMIGFVTLAYSVFDDFEDAEAEDEDGNPRASLADEEDFEVILV